MKPQFKGASLLQTCFVQWGRRGKKQLRIKDFVSKFPIDLKNVYQIYNLELWKMICLDLP